MELLEVQLCNSVAPFILVSRLRTAMEASDARRKFQPFAAAHWLESFGPAS